MGLDLVFRLNLPVTSRVLVICNSLVEQIKIGRSTLVQGIQPQVLAFLNLHLVQKTIQNSQIHKLFDYSPRNVETTRNTCPYGSTLKCYIERPCTCGYFNRRVKSPNNITRNPYQLQLKRIIASAFKIVHKHLSSTSKCCVYSILTSSGA